MTNILKEIKNKPENFGGKVKIIKKSQMKFQN